MSMTALSTLYDDLRINVPGCPNMILLKGLNWAIRELCKRQPVWRQSVTVWLIANRSCYRLNYPANSNIGIIISLNDKEGRKVSPITESELDEMDSTWRKRVADPVKAYLQPELNTLQVYPIPETGQSDALTAITSLVPSRDATEFDSELLNRYDQLLIAGAAYWIQSRPNWKWTSMEQAAVNHSIFTDYFEEAAINTTLNNVKAELKMRPWKLA
jgi:hypothetical protein